MKRPLRSVSLFLGAAALALVPWTAWLASSLPCRYLSRHWGVAWAGFDTALAVMLALTCIGALRRAPWLDRAAVAAATLLAADAWFDVVTSRGAAAVAVATTEAVAVELPVALLCLCLIRQRPFGHQSERSSIR
jgi:ABC-type polysaccharide/polyol phosphate export permease